RSPVVADSRAVPPAGEGPRAGGRCSDDATLRGSSLGTLHLKRSFNTVPKNHHFLLSPRCTLLSPCLNPVPDGHSFRTPGAARRTVPLVGPPFRVTTWFGKRRGPRRARPQAARARRPLPRPQGRETRSGEDPAPPRNS